MYLKGFKDEFCRLLLAPFTGILFFTIKVCCLVCCFKFYIDLRLNRTGDNGFLK